MQWGMQYTVGTYYAVGAKKGQTHAVGYAACSRYTVHSRC